MPLAPLFADIFDFVHLQLGDAVISWLTPVWVIGVGAILGLLLCSQRKFGFCPRKIKFA